jgi:hypothetical protein
VLVIRDAQTMGFADGVIENSPFPHVDGSAETRVRPGQAVSALTRNLQYPR